MSVYAVTRYTLTCNGRIPDASRKTGARLCLKAYEVPGDTPAWPKPGALRKLAAAGGWTRVPSPLGRKYDTDLCPDCSAREAAAKEHR